MGGPLRMERPRKRRLEIQSIEVSKPEPTGAYPALVRAVVSSVQSNGPINQSTSDANRLAEQLRLPFSGKPGNPVSKVGQDVPRLAKKAQDRVSSQRHGGRRTCPRRR